MDIEPGKQNSYIAKLESERLTSDTIVYFIEAQTGGRSSKTKLYTVDIKGMQADVQKLPELFITEVVVDTANTGGKDGYEFIEVYNNTNKPVHMNNYNIRYRDPEKGKESEQIWPFEQNDMTVPSGETHVFWVKNGSNRHLTAADFNRHYGVHLQEGKNLSGLKGGGMANKEARELVISTNSGEDVAAVHYYNERAGPIQSIIKQYFINIRTTEQST